MKMARDLMSPQPITISVRDAITDITDMFLERKFHSLPVVDDSSYPIGILTEFELTKVFIYIQFNNSSNDHLSEHIEILEIPAILKEDSPIAEVVRAIGNSPCNRVLVVNDDNQLSGIISPRDVLEFLQGEKKQKIAVQSDLKTLEQKLEQVEAEKEHLKEQIHLYSKFYEDSPYMMHSVNKHGIIMVANRKLHEFLGYEPSELVGMSIYDLYPKKHQVAAEAGLKKLIDEGKHSTVYSQMVTKDHWEKPVDISSSSVYDRRGKFVCTITITREINTELMWKALQSVESMKPKYVEKS